jgi:hypothetical protein
MYSTVLIFLLVVVSHKKMKGVSKQYTVGWVDIGTHMSTPGMYSFLCKSTENSNKKCFGQVTF